MNDNEWNARIKQCNDNALALATKSHDVKEAAKSHVLAAMRTFKTAYMAEGGVPEYPEETTKVLGLLHLAMRELDTKEVVELLGQDVEEFRVELPAWAVAK